MEQNANQIPEKITLGNITYYICYDDNGEKYLSYINKYKKTINIRFNNKTNDFLKTVYNMI